MRVLAPLGEATVEVGRAAVPCRRVVDLPDVHELTVLGAHLVPHERVVQ